MRAAEMSVPPDEFETIARLFRPLTGGAPEAFGLMDEAAAIPSRPGHDLIVTKDALVAGVHFLEGDPPGLIARKLLRTNLSDLAAKAAEPFAYFLAVSWPESADWAYREAFAAGLAEDQATYGVKLLGGDTTSTRGPLTASVTLLGWTPSGRMVPRGGARPGDIVLVSGTIGDGGLGLEAARGSLGLPASDVEWLAARYRLPEPRLTLRQALRDHASAAADVSDGLIADAGHIGDASGAGIEIDLDRLPLSAPAAAWLARQPDPAAARLHLATAGDDYEVVCTARPEAADGLMAGANTPLTVIGRVVEGQGTKVFSGGLAVPVVSSGWRHR